MKLTKTLAGIAAILLAGSALNAATVSFTQTQTVGSNYVDFYLGKFSTGLGTLTGVSVNVVYSTLTGSFIFTNQIATNARINAFNSAVTVMDPSLLGDLGYSTVHGTVYDVATSPKWQTTILPGHTSQTYTINATQNALTNNTQTIDPAYWDAYSSIGGIGTVDLQINDLQTITSTGSSYSVDSSLAGASTQLTITYTYTAGPVPVPEASTVIVQMLIVAGGVWMFVRRRRATAVRA